MHGVLEMDKHEFSSFTEGIDGEIRPTGLEESSQIKKSITNFLSYQESICSCDNFVEIYEKGIFFQKDSNEQKIVFISEEEKYYASRWNGHLPLAPMPVNETSPLRNTIRRKKFIRDATVRTN